MGDGAIGGTERKSFWVLEYPEVPLKLARDRRAAAKELLVSGWILHRPGKRRLREPRGRRTLCGDSGGVVPLYSVLWSSTTKGAGAAQDYEYLIPRLGKRSLSEITYIEIMGNLDIIGEAGCH